eukprot:gene4507-gene5264
MSFAKTAYEAIFRRNSTSLLFIAGGCLVFERLFNPITDNFFNSRNKG